MSLTARNNKMLFRSSRGTIFQPLFCVFSDWKRFCTFPCLSIQIFVIFGKQKMSYYCNLQLRRSCRIKNFRSDFNLFNATSLKWTILPKLFSEAVLERPQKLSTPFSLLHQFLAVFVKCFVCQQCQVNPQMDFSGTGNIYLQGAKVVLMIWSWPAFAKVSR